jgi:hypothetical protein
MSSDSVVGAPSAFAASRGTIRSAVKARAAAAIVTDAVVIDAVARFAGASPAPSTSRIMLALAGADRVVSSALRTAVGATLERLHEEARLVRTDDRGTRRWRLPPTA